MPYTNISRPNWNCVILTINNITYEWQIQKVLDEIISGNYTFSMLENNKYFLMVESETEAMYLKLMGELNFE